MTTENNPLLDWSYDAEDCSACFLVDDLCPYHMGVADGVDWITRHLMQIALDPELLHTIPINLKIDR